MAFDDRLQLFLLGLCIGSVLGYLTRLVQDIRKDVRDVKKELDEVDQIVKSNLGNHEKNEQGFMRRPWIANLAAILVVGLAFYAAIVSQKASNDMQASVDRNEIVTYCNLDITTKALTSLNERSTYSLSQTQANVDLQKAFADFFNLLLHQPPYDEKTRREAAELYQSTLNNFIEVAGKATNKIEDNPFPKVSQLVDCIQKGEVPGNSLDIYLDKMKAEGEQ